MKRLPIAEIARRLREAGFPPSFSDGESRVLVEIAGFLTQARPVSEAQVRKLAVVRKQKK